MPKTPDMRRLCADRPHDVVPVVLFVYRRLDKLRRTLSCLRANGIPLLIVYSDGPANVSVTADVEAVRALVRAIDWCRVDLRCQDGNAGLGRSIRRGVTEVLREYDCAIVFEDDIECVPGTYEYFRRALAAYAGHPRVMSVSGYTHPRLAPAGLHLGDVYFAGRYVCWGWATWRRGWIGMSLPAPMLVLLCMLTGVNPARYGFDLVKTALEERRRNVWAARFALLHLLRRGLTVSPSVAFTNHMGFDDSTTSRGVGDPWQVVLKPNAAASPTVWPEVREHPDSAPRYQAVYGRFPNGWRAVRSLIWKLRAWLRRAWGTGRTHGA